jgi:hypothetical protein
VDPEAAKLAALLAPIDRPRPTLPDPVATSVTPPEGTVVTQPQQPGASQPAATKPAAPKRTSKPIEKTKPTRRLEPGDLICPQCGEGNAPERKFCSRCGESLAIAETVKRKWWQRFLPKKKSGTKHPSKASVKAKRGLSASTVAAIRKVVTVLAIVVAFALALVPPFRSWANDHFVQPVTDKWHDFVTQEFDPVNPSGPPTATAETPDNPGTFAVDLNGDTFWLAPAAAGQAVLTLTFAEPVDLDRALIQNGARDQFSTFSRAHELHLVFDTGQTDDIALKDQPDPQKVTIHNGHGITSVEIHIQSTYAAIGNPDMAITEIELFTER